MVYRPRTQRTYLCWQRGVTALIWALRIAAIFLTLPHRTILADVPREATSLPWRTSARGGNQPHRIIARRGAAARDSHLYHFT